MIYKRIDKKIDKRYPLYGDALRTNRQVLRRNAIV